MVTCVECTRHILIAVDINLTCLCVCHPAAPQCQPTTHHTLPAQQQYAVARCLLRTTAALWPLCTPSSGSSRPRNRRRNRTLVEVASLTSRGPLPSSTLQFRLHCGQSQVSRCPPAPPSLPHEVASLMLACTREARHEQQAGHLYRA